MSNDAGRVLLEAQVPATEDAEVVRLMKKAGAIPILVSNTPDQCMFWETYNKVTGVTNNPFDTRRTVGGSSGGEVSLLIQIIEKILALPFFKYLFNCRFLQLS